MKKTLVLSCLLFLLGTVSQAQHLVSYTKVDSFTTDSLHALWKQNKIKKVIVPIKYDFDVYEVIYKTLYVDGDTITASGYIFLPLMPAKDIADGIPASILNHGTEMRINPNWKGLGGMQAVVAAYATDGYYGLYPHYIGLGKGERRHVYQHTESEAQASIDMVRALREFAEIMETPFNEDLYISGYSQGGHAAMASHKIMEEQYPNEFTVRASAPASGAYHMTGKDQQRRMFEPYGHQAYLPYLITSMDRAYPEMWDGDIYEVFVPPYDSLLRATMTGEYSIGYVSKRLPEVPADMLDPSLVEQYLQDTAFPLRVALADNDLYDWAPESPMLLCYCNSDEQVDYRNTLFTYDYMKDLGAKHVRLSNGGKKYDHNTCALFTSIQTKFFFDSIRKGKKRGRRGPIFKRFLISLAKLAVKPSDVAVNRKKLKD